MKISDPRAGADLATRWIALSFLAATLTGCYPGSDAQYSQRQAAARDAAATQAMRTATAQRTRGIAIAGDALRQRLVERTWISEYEKFPNGARGPYRTYDYFRQDGQFIRGHNWVYGDPVPVPGDYWRVDGPRLCILNQTMSAQPACYAVALDAGQALQLYIDAPGTPNHGLLTRVIERSIAGPPKPDLPAAR
jgi:hypothetical protein